MVETTGREAATGTREAKAESDVVLSLAGAKMIARLMNPLMTLQKRKHVKDGVWLKAVC